MTVLPYLSAADTARLPPIIIDSFAGGGGASTGIEMALGRSPDVAINHSTSALALHAANHPETIHLDSNIWDVNPREVTRGRRVGLLWASPDCTHFSKAKGGAPRDRNIRDLAWVIVDWAEQVRPDVICMENVEEFVTWGPVDEEGRVVEWLRGHTFTLTIAGADYVIVDIGLRMLTPRELYRAQGFPDDYVIEGVWEERGGDWHWRDFPKDVQVSCVGNSVCPPLAAAIVGANCQHLVEEREAAHG